MSKMIITNIGVYKRTFEGKDNPFANDNALTSKYYPSKKYLLRYTIEGYLYTCDRTYTKKSDAIKTMKYLLENNIDGRQKTIISQDQIEIMKDDAYLIDSGILDKVIS